MENLFKCEIILITFAVVTSSSRMLLVNGKVDYHEDHQGVGYSFAKFSGPVSGPAREIHTHDKHHGHSIDYVSKPDYQFEYGVEDPKSKVSQFRKENRQDDAVVGEYSYTDPLGHVRTVKYTADKIHGFRAEIYVDGKLEIPTLPQAPAAVSVDVAEDDGDVDGKRQQNVAGSSENSSSHYHDSGDYSSNEDY